MSARAIATVTVSFGLVSIPVKLYTANASGSSGVSFNMLHKKCGTRLKQQYICPTDNEVVGRDDTVKGYEYAKGQYVTFTEEELDKLDAVSTEAIEIVEFVPAEKVDAVYYDKAYYVGPEKGGEKAYNLLSEAMKKTGRVALARYSARGKQYLVMVRPVDRGLVVQQLRYADEVRPMSDVPLPDPMEVKEAELKLACQLVEQIASNEFHPEAYEDAVKKRQQELIQQKIAGQEVTAAPPEAPRGQIVDLMEALKASLAQKAPAKPADADAAPAEDEARKGPKRAAGAEGRSEQKKVKRVS